MTETIPQITNRYMNGKTLEAFAESLGIGTTKQSIQQWKEGKHEPSIMTLYRVRGSETAAPEAKEWARECLAAITAAAGVELEDSLDREIERRR